MRPNLATLSEEIVRWGFEIRVNSHDDWFLAFTNPTAGPWKRVMAHSEDGRRGEVLRFAVNEPRPDLILVSDKHRRTVIVEAKTNLTQLSHLSQISKTASMFSSLEKRLASLKSNEFWRHRCSYNFHLGLLWGPSALEEQNLSDLIESYSSLLDNKAESIMCIATELSDQALSYRTFDGFKMKSTNWFIF